MREKSVLEMVYNRHYLNYCLLQHMWLQICFVFQKKKKKQTNTKVSCFSKIRQLEPSVQIGKGEKGDPVHICCAKTLQKFIGPSKLVLSRSLDIFPVTNRHSCPYKVVYLRRKPGQVTPSIQAVIISTTTDTTVHFKLL